MARSFSASGTGCPKRHSGFPDGGSRAVNAGPLDAVATLDTIRLSAVIFYDNSKEYTNYNSNIRVHNVMEIISNEICIKYLLLSRSGRMVRPYFGWFDVARELDGPTGRHSSALASPTHALNLVFVIAAQRSKPGPRNEG